MECVDYFVGGVDGSYFVHSVMDCLGLHVCHLLCLWRDGGSRVAERGQVPVLRIPSAHRRRTVLDADPLRGNLEVHKQRFWLCVVVM